MFVTLLIASLVLGATGQPRPTCQDAMTTASVTARQLSGIQAILRRDFATRCDSLEQLRVAMGGTVRQLRNACSQHPPVRDHVKYLADICYEPFPRFTTDNAAVFNRGFDNAFQEAISNCAYYRSDGRFTECIYLHALPNGLPTITDERIRKITDKVIQFTKTFHDDNLAAIDAALPRP